jgi:c-di-GMP-related signal transduction protein
MKRAVIKGELSRRVRICSSETYYMTALMDLKSKLLTRHYPLQELNEQQTNSTSQQHGNLGTLLNQYQNHQRTHHLTFNIPRHANLFQNRNQQHNLDTVISRI